MGKEGKFVVIDLETMTFFKNEEGKLKYFDTEEEACNTCGMYELDASVLEIKCTHSEEAIWGFKND